MCDPIGTQLRLEMARRKMSQRKMCELTGLTDKTVKSILSIDDDLIKQEDATSKLKSISLMAKALNKKLKLTIS